MAPKKKTAANMKRQCPGFFRLFAKPALISLNPNFSKDDEDDLIVVPIHKRKELMNECCNLINSEWPRSKTARMVSLEASREGFPTSLVLMTPEDKLIGHCKISPIPNVPTACFVESVVIHKQYRSKGLGKYLMAQTESYVQKFGRQTVYLATKGQENFYSKLGYTFCEPISLYGTYQTMSADESNPSPESDPVISVVQVPAPPPPPLPNFRKKKGPPKSFMKKELPFDDSSAEKKFLSQEDGTS